MSSGRPVCSMRPFITFLGNVICVQKMAKQGLNQISKLGFFSCNCNFVYILITCKIVYLFHHWNLLRALPTQSTWFICILFIFFCVVVILFFFSGTVNSALNAQIEILRTNLRAQVNNFVSFIISILTCYMTA